MKDFKQIAGSMGYHGKILLNGLAKTACGTAVLATIALAIYVFVLIPSKGGYAAVFHFVAAAIIMGIALDCMYIMGGRKRRK